LTEREKHRNQLTGIGINLVSEVLNRCTTTKSNDGCSVTAWHNSAT
jgi:hypothetical protein